MITALMMVAQFSIILDIACEVCRYKFLDIAAAATENINTIALQYIERTITDVSRKHYLNAYAAEHMNNARLATATLGRGKNLPHCHLTFIHSKYSIVVAMSEMAVDHTIFCRYCYFHINQSINYFLFT